MGKKTKKAMTINGDYIEDLIPGYTTLSVTGRESLAGSLSTVDKIGDGSIFSSRRYGSRTLSISFVIQKNTEIELRNALELLANVVDVRNARIIFDDEPDKYYVADLGDTFDFNITLGVATGTFNLFCGDPFKYAIEETLVELQNDSYSTIDDEGNIQTNNTAKVFVVNNDGYKTYPRFEVSFPAIREDPTTHQYLDDGNSANCGYVMMAKTNQLNKWDGSKASLLAGFTYTIDGFDEDTDTAFFGQNANGSDKIAVTLKTRNDDLVYTPTVNGYLFLTIIDTESEISVTLANKKESSIMFGEDSETRSAVPTHSINFLKGSLIDPNNQNL